MLLKESAAQDVECPGAGLSMVKKVREGSIKLKSLIPSKRMHSYKRQTDAPLSKTITHFHMEICTAGVQCYFRFTETARQRQYYSMGTRRCKNRVAFHLFSLSLENRVP